jgi:hypothetical protein
MQAVPPPDDRVAVNEKSFFPDQTATTAEQQPALMTIMAELEGLRELGSSRFGVVHLVRRVTPDGSCESFAVKCYTADNNREGAFAFHHCMRSFLDLWHSAREATDW